MPVKGGVDYNGNVFYLACHAVRSLEDFAAEPPQRRARTLASGAHGAATKGAHPPECTQRERCGQQVTMRTIAITNQKGGSGKTTTAVSVAGALGARDTRVLVVDLDPQASASAWLGRPDGGKGLLEVLTEGRKLAELAVASSAPGVDVVPASAWLVGAEKALAGEVGTEMLLRRALDRLPDRWDVVLVDCPPSLGLLSVAALVGCGEVFVPVEARVMALSGLASLVQTLDRVRDRLNPQLALSGILACRVDNRTRLSQEVVDTLRERFGRDVLRTVVHENVRLAEAPSHVIPIHMYDPRCTGTEDYTAVAKELLGRGPKHRKGSRL
jgi:chromosome partitioning protein